MRWAMCARCVFAVRCALCAVRCALCACAPVRLCACAPVRLCSVRCALFAVRSLSHVAAPPPRPAAWRGRPPPAPPPRVSHRSRKVRHNGALQVRAGGQAGGRAGGRAVGVTGAASLKLLMANERVEVYEAMETESIASVELVLDLPDVVLLRLISYQTLLDFTRFSRVSKGAYMKLKYAVSGDNAILKRFATERFKHNVLIQFDLDKVQRRNEWSFLRFAL